MTMFEFVTYDEESQAHQRAVLAAFKEAEKAIHAIPNGRGKSLALTKLEESYMWCGKAIRDGQIDRGG